MGWAAYWGGLELAPIVLYAAAVAWTIGYDTIYAHQDKEDDLLMGLKSTALQFGSNTASWLSLFYGVTIGGLAFCGWKPHWRGYLVLLRIGRGWRPSCLAGGDPRYRRSAKLPGPLPQQSQLRRHRVPGHRPRHNTRPRFASNRATGKQCRISRQDFDLLREAAARGGKPRADLSGAARFAASARPMARWCRKRTKQSTAFSPRGCKARAQIMAGFRRRARSTPSAFTRAAFGSSIPSTARAISSTAATSWTVAACLAEDGAPVLAAVINPVRGEVFEARAGAGALLNGRRISASAHSELSGARVAVSAGRSLTQENVAGALAGRRSNRRKFDASIVWHWSHPRAADASFALNPKWEWDIAAGALLVSEAGGMVTSSCGAPLKFNRPRRRCKDLLRPAGIAAEY